MMKRFTALLFTLLLSNAAFAAPTVTGNTISWPDDGWYQVQSATDPQFKSICEGGTSCVVEDGQYIVINHTTGERYTDVSVPGLVELKVDGPTVVGNTISWDIEGWYQVQDSTNYKTVCSGFEFCNAAPGNYIVINHTTGKRYEGVVVGDDNDGGDNGDDKVAVEGNTISWPNDGWYQVQNATTLISVCGGGSSCVVEDGTYIVINHATGQRYENVRVNVTDNNGGDPSSPGDSSTRVTFDITVPVYVSNELQVRLRWGDVDTTASWEMDESWTVSADLASNTENQLVVTFNDDNGGITLGSFEQSFTTGSDSTEIYSIAANQFNTNRWDEDADGINNIAELTTGTDPYTSNPAGHTSLPSQPVQNALTLAADKTFRINWQPASGAEFYRVLENPDGVSGYTQVGEDITASVQQFDHRVALYNRINATYIVQACNALGCTDSGERAVPEAIEQAIGYFKASNAESEDSFGDAIALSGDGSTLAVAAPSEDGGSRGVNGDQNDNSAIDSGAVYVFVRNNGTWEQQAYLKASNAKAGDGFGWSVTLSSNGDTLAVGMPNEDSPARGVNGDQSGNLNPPAIVLGQRTYLDSGAAYVFARTDGTWQQQAYLKASNTRGYDSFGHALSLSGDGNTLAVGAPFEDATTQGVNGDPFYYRDGSQQSGAVYVFERSNGSWRHQAYLKETLEGGFRTISHRMGEGVSISEDGSTIAAGGTFSLIVFARAGNSWQQEASLMQGNTVLVSDCRISLSASGDTLAMGTTGDFRNSTGIDATNYTRSIRRPGAVYLFEREGTTWERGAFFKASNTEADDYFGVAVSLSADGSTLAVGASGEDSVGSGFNSNQSDNSRLEAGAVYLFKRKDGFWQQQNFIKAINSWGDKRFAQVSLSADGETLAVGAGGDSSSAIGINGDHFNDGAPGSGAVHLY